MPHTTKYRAGLQENFDAECDALPWVLGEYTELPFESIVELSTHQCMCLVDNRHAGGWNAYVDLVDPEFGNSDLCPAPTEADTTLASSRSWLPTVEIAAARRWLRGYGFDSKLLDELFDWQLANLVDRLREGDLQEYGAANECLLDDHLPSGKSEFDDTVITRRTL